MKEGAALSFTNAPQQMTPEETFRTHLLNEGGIMKARKVGLAFAQLLGELREICPAGRELALVTTKLEEACFFAKKSVARMPENQKE